MKIEIISACRGSATEFETKTALGISLLRLNFDRRLVARISVNNACGLPQVYNHQWQTAADDSIVVFMHDDVWIDDYFFADRLIEGLGSYDLIGVAGNRRRLPLQPAWAFIDRQFTWDQPENLSGAIAHGRQPFGSVTYFGPAPAACELLDGVMLAVRKSTLLKHRIQFDQRFTFDFYDMDLCRSARQAGLSLGTCATSLTHQSDGGFGNKRWQEAYATYLEKWGA